MKSRDRVIFREIMVIFFILVLCIENKIIDLDVLLILSNKIK